MTDLCELPELRGAEPLAAYAADFYAGQPCLTRHAYGSGTAYYLAAKVEQSGLNAIYDDIAASLRLTRALPDPLPAGVVATERGRYRLPPKLLPQPPTPPPLPPPTSTSSRPPPSKATLPSRRTGCG